MPQIVLEDIDMVGLKARPKHLSPIGSFPSMHWPEQGVCLTPPVWQEGFRQSLCDLGFNHLGPVYRNLSVPMLVEHALDRGEGVLAHNGALVVETGKYTGRSPRDRFIVEEPSSRNTVDWGTVNVPLSEAHFDQLYRKMQAYLQGRDLYVFDGFVGADPAYRKGVRIITEQAYQSLFSHQLFLRPTPLDLETFQPDFTVIAMPGLQGDPQADGLHSEAFIVLHLGRRMVLVGGTHYAGEIKKSIFALMNYYMPDVDVLPMHGAANLDHHGHTALFFGLSGTGKTSLSTDPTRNLIGDDEHGWSEEGIFNFEGGCYAKTIHLSRDHEPQIWDAIRFGTVLENVSLESESRWLDYNDDSLTENTRAAYPLTYIDNASLAGVGSHPKAVIFLTADAFGVLPPISKLSREQAMYHFLSGYTSKLAGTERDIAAPQVTFSACFGQCFFPRSPLVYADMLGKRLQTHHETQVFLVNTGWFGGPYGVGQRIPIQYTRTMVNAALAGTLDHIPCHTHPIFRIGVPETVPGVPVEFLDPQGAWDDPEAYLLQAKELAHQFRANFQQFEGIHPDILAAGPMVE